MKMVRNLFLVLALILSTFVFAAGIPEVKNTDSVTMGRGANGDDKTFTFNIGDGASNPQILIDDITKLFEFNLGLSVTGNGAFTGNVSGVDGTFTGVLSADGNDATFGDGINSDKKQIFDIGAGASNPYLGWSATSNALVFNNGISEKKFGTGSGGAGGGINLLLNPSFEDTGSPILNWSNSGGTLTQEDHVNGRENNEKFARFVSASAAQFFESDAVTISDDIGPGCMADFKYSQGDTAFDYKVLKSPFADPADVVSEGSVSGLTEFQKAPTLTFPCAGGDQLKLRIVSTGAGTIDVDEAYLGSNKGFVEGTSITESKVYTPTNQGFGTLTNIDVRYIHNGDRLRIIGGFTTGTVNASEARLFLPPGLTVKNQDSIQKIGGTFSVGNNQIPKGGNILAFNGDDHVKFSTADTWSGNSRNALSPEVGNQVAPSGVFLTFQFTIFVNEINSGQGQEAFVPEQANFFISGNIGGAIASLGNTGGTAVEIGQSSWDMTLEKGAAQIKCGGTNPPTGLTCSAGVETMGVVFDAPVSGRYKACFSFATNNGSASGSYRVVQTAPNNNVILKQGKSISGSSSSGGTISTRLCDSFDLDVGQNSLSVFYDFDDSINILADRGSTTYERDIHFTIELEANFAARPVIQNMVSTPISSGIETVGCSVDNVNAPINANDCSDWISSITSVGGASERVEFNLNSKFTGKTIVSCNATALYNSSQTSQTFMNMGFIPNYTAPTKIEVTGVLSTNGAGNGNFGRSLTCIFRR